MYVVDNATVRRLDQVAIEAGTPGIDLMERAGTGATALVRERLRPDDGWVLVVCGKGNNGGDGLVVARQLHLAGVPVSVALVTRDLAGDARSNLERAESVGVELVDLGDDPRATLGDLHRRRPGRWLVDGVLGTGFKPPLRGGLAGVCGAMRDLPRRRIALDCPSGLDGDTGAIDELVAPAELTITFGLPKWGLLLPPGRAACGRIELVDLGIDEELVQRVVDGGETSARWIDARAAARGWPRRAVDAHKYRTGSLLVVGGSASMSGAVALAVNAANRAGAGLVEAVVPQPVQGAVDVQCTESLVHGVAATERGGLSPSVLASTLARCAARDAVVIGCGAGDDRETAGLLVDLLDELHRPVVIDADGLNAFARCERTPRMPADSLITPHSGELARLMDSSASEIDADRRKSVRDAARRLGTVVLHKGAPTFVATASGEMAVIGSGGPALATAGSGDVLAGICGALLAAGLSAFDAACVGAWVHGRCGDRAAARLGQAGVVARDLLDELGPVGRELEAMR